MAPRTDSEPLLPSQAARPFSAPGRPLPTADGRVVRVGLLLAHGFTGSPHSLRPWAEAAAAAGLAVELPLLPGHGTRWEDLNRTGFSDWYDAVERAFLGLRGRCDVLVVAGLSMGGSLALRLAQVHPDGVDGLVLVNPAVDSRDRRLALLPVLHRVVASFPGLGNDIKREGVTEGGYDRTPLAALHSLRAGWAMVRASLPLVQQPVLICKSDVDHVVDDASITLLRNKLGSLDYTEIPLHDSYHVATLDNDADLIVSSSLAFIGRLAGVELAAPTTAPTAGADLETGTGAGSDTDAGGADV